MNMINEEKITTEERFAEVYEDAYTEAYPVCPVIRRIAEEMAEEYFRSFQFAERKTGGKILNAFDRMCSNQNYSLAVCLLAATISIQGGKDPKYSFDLLNACEEASEGAYAMFFDIFLTDEKLAHLMWEASLVDSLEKIS